MMQIKLMYLILFGLGVLSCNSDRNKPGTSSATKDLAEEVKEETLRSWEAYKTYAWGHDELKPLSKGHSDWYAVPLHLSMIEAYSSLYIMGLYEEAQEIESFVTDSVDFKKDIFVKTVDVNTRLLGGLLCMFELSMNPKILKIAEDLGRRLIPAFDTPTGLPHLYINLKTGESKGDVINVSEATTFAVEMGVLSYYTQDPTFYQKAKAAVLYIYNNRSDIGLVRQSINTNTGEWQDDSSHIGKEIGGYFEYLFKCWRLFGDSEMLHIFKSSLLPIQKYLPDSASGKFWYARVDAISGDIKSTEVSIESANWSALLAYQDDLEGAEKCQLSWDWLWNQNGAVPDAYDFQKNIIVNSRYALKAELIESIYYLQALTDDPKFLEMGIKYWVDFQQNCKTELACTSLSDIRSKEKEDLMPSHFIGETMKFFYLTFRPSPINLNTCVFSAAGHPFNQRSYKESRILDGLGI